MMIPEILCKYLYIKLICINNTHCEIYYWRSLWDMNINYHNSRFGYHKCFEIENVVLCLITCFMWRVTWPYHKYYILHTFYYSDFTCTDILLCLIKVIIIIWCLEILFAQINIGLELIYVSVQNICIKI